MSPDERLRQALLRDGILYASDTQRIIRVDGTEAPWMLDSLGVTLAPEGARLAARALLRLLRRFESRQLATFGLTAVPLLQAVLLESKLGHTGLLVRKDVKPRGSLRRIEGHADRARPVVLVDDSISSGNALSEGARHLREAGFEVEGAVCLVGFGPAGTARLREEGVRVECVFDVFRDLAQGIRYADAPCANPTRDGPPPAWRGRAPEGLTAPALARFALEQTLLHGRPPRPPRRVAGPLDARGGAWVSLRLRQDLDQRLARSGVLVFPGESPLPGPEVVVRAAAATAQALREAQGRRALALARRCALAVTAFGPLRPSSVGALDEHRHGVVVRSLARPGVIGGALPRMPGIRGAWELYAHAAHRNAGLYDGEPHELFRHAVHKHVEDGEAWPLPGAPRPPRPEERAGPVRPWLLAARRQVQASLRGRAAQPAALPRLPGVEAVFLTTFQGGHLRGCVGTETAAWRGRPATELLRVLADATLADRRFRAQPRDADLAVSLSFLRRDLEVGDWAPHEVMGPTRFGEQAMQVRRGRRSALLLPQVAPWQNLDRLGFAQQAAEKAGLARRPMWWTRWDAASWLLDAHGPRPLVDGVGVPTRVRGSKGLPDLAALWLRHLGRHSRGAGTPVVSTLPFSGAVQRAWEPAWLAHRAWTFARLGRAAEAARTLGLLRPAVKRGELWLTAPGGTPTLAEVAFTTLAACELRARRDAALWAQRLVDALTPHGAFATHPGGVVDEAWLDFVPGQALLALAHAARLGAARVDAGLVDRALGFARRRWRARGTWPQVSWLAQAFLAWGRLRRDRTLLGLALELADAFLPNQSQADGGFLHEGAPEGGAGATTAVLLEGVAAGRAAARALGDAGRVRRYGAALDRGVGYLDRLTLQERDRALLPDPDLALGGLRTSPRRGDVRLDFVQHALALSALVNERG